MESATGCQKSGDGSLSRTLARFTQSNLEDGAKGELPFTLFELLLFHVKEGTRRLCGRLEQPCVPIVRLAFREERLDSLAHRKR